MKKILAPVLLAGLGAASAQVWQSRPFPASAALYGVHFASSGYSGKNLAVGAGGTLARGDQFFVTKSAQASIIGWDAQNSGTTENLYGTHSGISVGANGRVVTAGSGVAWVSRFSGDSADLNAVFSPDGGTRAWAVGTDGTILKSTNSGADWTKQTSGTIQHLQAVHFVSPDTGWVVGQGSAIRKTTNGGATWTAQSPPVSAEFYGVHFTSGSTGYVVGSSGVILKTTNAGATWLAQSSGTTRNLHAVHFAVAQIQGRPDSLIGCAVGRSGTIVCTGNGGADWSVESTPHTRTLTAVHLFGGWQRTQAVAVGDSGTVLVRDEITGSIASGPLRGVGWATVQGRTLRFDLSRAAQVSLEIASLDGRVLWRSAPALRAPGEQSHVLPARLPSGLALLSLRVDGRQSVTRVLLP